MAFSILLTAWSINDVKTITPTIEILYFLKTLFEKKKLNIHEKIVKSSTHFVSAKA